MALQDVINAALEKIQHIAKTETVFGDPVNAGGVTLIPVSKVSVGFAAGGAGKEDKGGSGAGTGGGVNVTPVALIAVSNGNVQVHQFGDGEPDIEKLLAMAPDAVRKVADLFRKKTPDNNSKGKPENNPPAANDGESGGPDKPDISDHNDRPACDSGAIIV